MTASRALIVAFVAACFAPAAAHTEATSPQGCLAYEPAIVTLTGRLQQRTYPGPPNYQSVTRGDTPETGFYLALAKPICTAGVWMKYEDPQENVKLVQLVLEPAQFAALRPSLGRTVSLRGMLFPWQTGHHHAPLLLTKIERVKSTR